MTKLDDTIELEPSVDPKDIERVLIDAVNLGWRAGGNDGRVNVPANFVGFMLLEVESLRAEVEYWRSLAPR